MKIRDRQRSKVYKWERAVWTMVDLKATLSLDECKALIRKMHGHVTLRNARWMSTPDVNDGRGCRKATYRQSTNTITLPKWARSKWVVCHELAHALIRSDKFEAHGAEFVEMLIYLVTTYAKDEHGMSEEGLRSMAIDMGVKVA